MRFFPKVTMFDVAVVRLPVHSLLLIAALSACTSNPREVPESVLPVDPNELLTVDCLLPGRVRQLGQGRLYQEPHRPIKTAASTCAIRGGDFVRYDRADFRTSLSVWLDAAKTGDPEAQTYVGEIFEKGMGVPADYVEAARWYTLAANQGHDRARINLGYLYETGLGVDKDITHALNLYREAAGLSEGNLEYVANADLAARKAQQANYDQTREQLAEAKRQLTDMERRYQAQQESLRNSERALRELQQAADEQRIAVARQRQAAVVDDQALSTSMAKVEELTEALAKARDSEHTLQDALLVQQEQAIELQSQLDAAMESQRSQETRESDGSGAQQHLAEQLRSAERERQNLQEMLDAQRVQVSSLEQRYADQAAQHRTEIERLRLASGADARAAEQRLAEVEQTLAQREREIEELNDKLSSAGQALLRATVVSDVAKADAVSQVGYDGLRIELINLKTEILRNGALVALLPDRAHRQVIGQVLPSRSLARLEINERESLWNADGVFEYLRDDDAQLDIVARDKTDQSYRRSFRLREPLITDINEPMESESGGDSNVLMAEAMDGIDFGDYHALIVGNGDYARLSNVANAVSDARRMDLVLRNRFGFKTEVLLDAGKPALLAAFARYQRSLNAQDNFVLFYSGHCKQATSYAPGYWLLRDSDPHRNDTWLSLPSLVAAIDALPARHVLVIVDSCSPGTLTATAVPIPVPGAAVDQRVAWYRKMVDARVRSVLASDIAQPWSERQKIAGASPFTVALLDTLESASPVVVASELYAGIRQASSTRFRQLLSDADVRYAPIRHAGHEAGEFLFVRGESLR